MASETSETTETTESGGRTRDTAGPAGAARDAGGASPGGLRIVNPDPRYAPVALLEPTTLGYIHVAAQVRPRRAPFLPESAEKTAFLERLKSLARDLEGLETVVRVQVFDAVLLAPVARASAYVREHEEAVHVPRFDVVVLVETASPAVVRDVQQAPAYGALLDAVQGAARDVHVMAARDAKRLGDVEPRPEGLYLFNYFVGDDPEVVLRLWDYLAAWYVAETGLRNSVVLVPLEGERSDYVLINHARWDVGLARLFWEQLSRHSFRTYVLANLEANRAAALPILYRLA